MDETPPQRRRRRHPPNKLPPCVFQHQVRVDRSATEHEIESMPLHNVQAVIGFCHHQAHRIVTVAVWKQSTHSDECLVDLPQPLDVGNAYPGRQVRRSRLRSEKVVHGPIPHYV